MMVWEEITKKPFSLDSLSDVLKYMYTCYTCYNEDPIELTAFLDLLTDKDVNEFAEELKKWGDGSSGSSVKKK